MEKTNSDRIRVLWFSASCYERRELDKMSDNDLYTMALRSTLKGNARIWDTLFEFQEDLNDDEVDVANGFVYFVCDSL